MSFNIFDLVFVGQNTTDFKFIICLLLIVFKDSILTDLTQLYETLSCHLHSSMLDRSRTRIFWIILEMLVSQQFLIDLRIISQNCFMPRVISNVYVIFQPPGVKKWSKTEWGEGHNSPFPIKRKPRSQNFTYIHNFVYRI